MLEAGDTVPEFELTAHDGSLVSSQALRGRKYLLYFYPKADTPGCTKEACAFRDAWDEVREAGLEVFGVSFDSPAGNRAFAEKYRLPFRLLSDADQSLARAAGAKLPLLPVPRRISYLVGDDGTVIRSYPSVHAASHAAEVLQDLRTLAAR